MRWEARKEGRKSRLEKLGKGIRAIGAGDEDDAYLSDYKNMELIDVGYVWQQFDHDILQYIDMPVGSKLIRISSKEFEIDH